jgi:hypothetical protein
MVEILTVMWRSVACVQGHRAMPRHDDPLSQLKVGRNNIAPQGLTQLLACLQILGAKLYGYCTPQNLLRREFHSLEEHSRHHICLSLFFRLRLGSHSLF